jgi:hypothetical protein
MANIAHSPNAQISDRGVRDAMSVSIRRSGRSREEIADAMSSILGIVVTVSMLNGYVAPSSARMMPACFVPAFCNATGDDLLQRELLGFNLKRLVALAEVSEICPNTPLSNQPVPTKAHSKLRSHLPLHESAVVQLLPRVCEASPRPLIAKAGYCNSRRKSDLGAK